MPPGTAFYKRGKPYIELHRIYGTRCSTQVRGPFYNGPANHLGSSWPQEEGTQNKYHHLFACKSTSTPKTMSGDEENKEGAPDWIERCRRRMWIRNKEKELAPGESAVFLAMQQRKLERKLKGVQTRRSKFQVVALFVLLLLVYGFGRSGDFEGGDKGKGHPSITLEFYQVLLICGWILLCIVVQTIFEGRNILTLITWVVIYYPLVAIAMALTVRGDYEYKSYERIYFGLIVVQVVSIAVYLIINFFYPWFLKSSLLSKTIGAGRFWHIHAVSDWTMVYDGKYGRFSKRYSCRYDGETNDSGIPHGYGKWMDDAYGGEVLTGMWEKGKPIAPYSSRQYGTGDTFCAVTIAFFEATDDEFDKSKFYPTCDSVARCGVASVECSIYGSFYSHLPRANKLYGPHTCGEEASIADCCARLSCQLERDLEDQNFVTIHANDTDVNVDGHVEEATGLTFSEDVDQIVIKVRREDPASNGRPPNKCLPLAPGNKGELSVFKHQSNLYLEDDDVSDVLKQEGIVHRHCTSPKVARLEVLNWVSDKRKEALIYFPGFNSPTKKSLAVFGQFMAMTKLSAHVYPILFEWPTAQILSYRHASQASVASTTREKFLQLLKGLADAGIRHVQLMSHSMGVQPLLGVFENKSDGSRSDVSQLFRLKKDSSFRQGSQGDKDKLLICKNIIMLNPDFPLDSFIEHAFLSIRQICDNITVLGDKGDQALLISSFINGFCNWLDHDKASVLKSRSEKEAKSFQLVRTVGRSIDLLYFPGNKKSETDEENNSMMDNPLIFSEVPPIILSQQEQTGPRNWLDIDVIDTTLLDTNVNDLRHSAFNINPFVLNDLQELIITGKRAARRSSLIYRQGNNFSYCQAPSYVAF